MKAFACKRRLKKEVWRGALRFPVANSGSRGTRLVDGAERMETVKAGRWESFSASPTTPSSPFPRANFPWGLEGGVLHTLLFAEVRKAYEEVVPKSNAISELTGPFLVLSPRSPYARFPLQGSDSVKGHEEG